MEVLEFNHLLERSNNSQPFVQIGLNSVSLKFNLQTTFEICNSNLIY